MTTEKKLDPVYFAGDSERERQRLQDQSNLINPFMRDLFRRAGIRPGMRVLDVGSGVGDVAMLAADFVGETGSVIGVDMNPAILETARARVAAAGYNQVSFVPGDIRTVELVGEFDAVVGRAVLLYLADPAQGLQRVRSLLRPGGCAAFLELDCTTMLDSYPHAPLADKIRYWITETIRRSGADVQLGYNLRKIFLDAGFPEPELQMNSMMGGGPNWSGYAYAANSLRSMLPHTLRFGIASSEEIAINTLADRLRDEVVSQNGTLLGTSWVSAWARK